MSIAEGAIPLAVVKLDKPCKHVRKFVEVVSENGSTMNNPDDERGRGGTLYVGKAWEVSSGLASTQEYRLWLEPLR